ARLPSPLADHGRQRRRHSRHLWVRRTPQPLEGRQTRAGGGLQGVAMSADTDVAVQLKAVTKTYGKGASAVTALRGGDLGVRGGELLMLVGPSGCGKTTLISVAAGILDRDGGDCRVFGEDLQAMSDGARVRYRGDNVGFVFQSFNLIPTLSAAEN